MPEENVLDIAKGTKITFRFQPKDIDNSNHYVIKSDANGAKRRYVMGVSSGARVDQHEERMTPECIKSFMEQANTGDILLYADVHGIRSSEDIGILTKAFINESGDWETEYRLYDEDDGIGQVRLEQVEAIWKQLTGQPPYKRPRQKGFSVEGYIPPDGILQAERDANGKMRRRVINNVLLDGVILVPRPAYKDSIATAVFKALGELPPWTADKIQKSVQNRIQERIESEDASRNFYDKKIRIDNVLDEMIGEVMQNETVNKSEQLSIVFDEYKSSMMDMVMKAGSVNFKQIAPNTENIDSEDPYRKVDKADDSKARLLNTLNTNLSKLQSVVARIKGGK